MKETFKKVINADGRMTILGVSTFSDNVAEAIKYAGQNFFVMEEFKEQINKDLKKIIQTKMVHVVNSAGAGITLAIAAAIYKNKVYDVNKLVPYQNHIIIPKGHNIDFGAPIESLINLVGGKIVEAGFANKCSKEEVIYHINETTCALMYVVSHHCVQKNTLDLHEMIEIAKQYNLPLILDCAAEEDFKKYSKMDIDVVIFSGSKAIQGPTSGFLFGQNTKLISNIKLHSKVIGRAMKIGKENLLGLYVAIQDYKMNTKKLFDKFAPIFIDNNFVDISKSIDERGIERIQFTIKNSKLVAKNLGEILKNEDPAIYLRTYKSKQGILEIDLRNITIEDAKIIDKKITKCLGGENEK